MAALLAFIAIVGLLFVAVSCAVAFMIFRGIDLREEEATPR